MQFFIKLSIQKTNELDSEMANTGVTIPMVFNAQTQLPLYICETFPPPGNFVHPPRDMEILLFLGG